MFIFKNYFLNYIKCYFKYKNSIYTFQLKFDFMKEYFLLYMNKNYKLFVWILLTIPNLSYII